MNYIMKYKINEKQFTHDKMHPFQALNSRVLRSSPELHPVAVGISSRVLTLPYRQCVLSPNSRRWWSRVFPFKRWEDLEHLRLLRSLKSSPDLLAARPDCQLPWRTVLKATWSHR